ncbi:hypothetical protein B1R94_19485 [Mycolicibacterium litorale]|nr:hypothetical protein B1R94_19485 [Mycolicibacterium litorale]
MIGAIADDFTGATDVAIAFRHAGLRTAIVFDTTQLTELPETDAAVVALKTRTTPADLAVAQSLTAVAWLRARGATQIFFKYCSTFDSSPQGNIGPVADALLNALDAEHAVFVPASPLHLRTQYLGHLFVGDVLLSESTMRDHPLTPMTDSYLPRVLSRQTAHRVGLVSHRDVRQGAGRVANLLRASQNFDVPYSLVDAIDERDLAAIGAACLDDPLVTGAAGLAGGLGIAHARRLGRSVTTAASSRAADGSGPGAVLAGSCSARTLEQIDEMHRRHHPALRLDAVTAPDPDALTKQALDWYDRQLPASAPLIYTSLPPAKLRSAQAAIGAEHGATILDAAMGKVASGLVARGVRRLVIAGGETSGAVVRALGIAEGVIGGQAAPGVAWIVVDQTSPPLALLLKSGNFGDRSLLADAAVGAR